MANKNELLVELAPAGADIYFRGNYYAKKGGKWCVFEAPNIWGPAKEKGGYLDEVVKDGFSDLVIIPPREKVFNFVADSYKSYDSATQSRPEIVSIYGRDVFNKRRKLRQSNNVFQGWWQRGETFGPNDSEMFCAGITVGNHQFKIEVNGNSKDEVEFIRDQVMDSGNVVGDFDVKKQSKFVTISVKRESEERIRKLNEFLQQNMFVSLTGVFISHGSSVYEKALQLKKVESLKQEVKRIDSEIKKILSEVESND